MAYADEQTGILNIDDRDTNWVKILFDDYTATAPGETTPGILQAWQLFIKTYAIDPRDVTQGFNFTGTPITGINKVKYDETDEAGYLEDKFNNLDGIEFEVATGTSKVLGIRLSLKETASTTGAQSILSDSQTLKRIKALDDSIEVTSDDDYVYIRSLSSGGGGVEYKLYNDTGALIPEGTPLHAIAKFEFEGVDYPTFELAKADKHETCQGTIVYASEDIADASLGEFVLFSEALTWDTSNLTAGLPIWLSTTEAGKYTSTRPEFPNFAIQLGGCYNSTTSGQIFTNQTTDSYNIFNRGWDGSIVESFDFRVTSDGTIITGTLENVNTARNLTLILGDNYTFDTTTTPATVTLIEGTDSDTQTNYVYIPKSTKVLTVSSSGFPTTESYCRIAVLEVQSATNVQSVGGVRKNQNTNNHIAKEGDNGALNHIRAWIRKQYATWDSGCEVTLDATAQNGYLTSTGGIVTQMHDQTMIPISMPTSSVLIKNDPDIPYRETDNLNTIDKFSDGSNWNNNYGKIVVWLIANKAGEPSFLCVNLPRDSYNNESTTLEDPLGYADYSIPTEYKSNAVLLGAFVIRISNGALTYNGASSGYQDLRGSLPITVGGASGGGGVTTLLALTDILETTYTGNENKLLKVNSLGTGVEFSAIKIADDGTINPDGETTSFGGDIEAKAGTFTRDNGAEASLFIDALGTSSSALVYQLDSVSKWASFCSNNTEDFVLLNIENSIEFVFGKNGDFKVPGEIDTQGNNINLAGGDIDECATIYNNDSRVNIDLSNNNFIQILEDDDAGLIINTSGQAYLRGSGTNKSYIQASAGGDIDLTVGTGGNLNINGTAGFTGTGTYTNLTIVNGIITNAT